MILSLSDDRSGIDCSDTSDCLCKRGCAIYSRIKTIRDSSDICKCCFIEGIDSLSACTKSSLHRDRSSCLRADTNSIHRDISSRCILSDLLRINTYICIAIGQEYDSFIAGIKVRWFIAFDSEHSQSCKQCISNCGALHSSL